MREKLVRIGVFYDGNFFLHISNYYNYEHPRQRRLSIVGLHDFIVRKVADEEDEPVKRCRIIDAHYFRGRLSAHEANQRGDMLYWDRLFDDILMSAGVSTHYLPLKVVNGRREERGVDVWLALEAYEQAIRKKYDVVVLIASDGDYVTLARKLHTLGTRVMLLSWDFDFLADNGKQMITRTSQDLLEEVTYPLVMHDLIDQGLAAHDPVIGSIFVAGESRKKAIINQEELPEGLENGTVLSLKNGFGFIKYPPNNLFFHHTSLVNADFNDLQEGDPVAFQIGTNEEGEEIAVEVHALG
jgi:cold shock CspA family protein/uncharacterized LabA/DUF88 family protein